MFLWICALLIRIYPASIYRVILLQVVCIWINLLLLTENYRISLIYSVLSLLLLIIAVTLGKKDYATGKRFINPGSIL